MVIPLKEEMMQQKRTIIWILTSLIGAVLMSGCNTGITPLGGRYDLAEYLFPGEAGTLVYKVYTAQKAKGESSYTQPEYQEDAQMTVAKTGNTTAVTDKSDAHKSNDYTVDSDRITVMEHDTNLTYHFDRTVSSVQNFVQEATIKAWQEAHGDVTITYECNATEHQESMVIDPDPKKYTDILKIECVRKRITSATVGTTHFETVVEDAEEQYYTQGGGMIQSTINTCQYTQVDGVQESEEGCTQRTYKIWAFVTD